MAGGSERPRNSRSPSRSTEQMWSADRSVYHFYFSDEVKKILQCKLKSRGKDHPDCISKNDGQKLYTAEDVCEILEREAEKQQHYIQEKLSLLQSRESSLKYTVTILSKRLEDSEKQLEMQKTISLGKSQELEESNKVNILLRKELSLTSMLSPDMEVKKCNEQIKERETVEMDKPKPVDDEDKPKPDFSDKVQILQEGTESFQMLFVSQKEQLDEAHSILKKKEERVIELDSTQEKLQMAISDKTSQLKSMLETKEKRINEQELEIANKCSQLEELKNMLETRDKRVNELEAMHKRLQAKVDDKTSEIEELNNMLEIKEDQVTSTQEQLHTTIANTTSQLVDLQNILGTKEERVNELESTQEQLLRLNADGTSKIEELETLIANKILSGHESVVLNSQPLEEQQHWPPPKPAYGTIANGRDDLVMSQLN